MDFPVFRLQVQGLGFRQSRHVYGLEVNVVVSRAVNAEIK